MKHSRFELRTEADGTMSFVPLPDPIDRITLDYWTVFRNNAVFKLFEELEAWFEGLEDGDEEAIDLYDEDKDETTLMWTADVAEKAWELAYVFMAKFETWTKDKQAHEAICSKFYRKTVPESRLKTILNRLYGRSFTFAIDELREATTLGAMIETVLPFLEEKVKALKSEDEDDEDSGD